jgi:hypothetical protein
MMKTIMVVSRMLPLKFLGNSSIGDVQRDSKDTEGYQPQFVDETEG